MQLSFSCPNCGKEYDLPLSLAGKRARCKRCSNEFVIPQPLESHGPRSSEAIPVAPVIEPPRPAPLPRTSQAETRPAEPALDAYGDDDDAPYPLDPPARPAAAPARAPQSIPRSPKSASARTASEESPTRPPWLIPAIAGGAFATLLITNVGLFFVFVGRNPGTKPKTVANHADLSGGGLADNSGPKAARVKSPSPAPTRPVAPPKNSRKAAAPKKVVPLPADDATDLPMNTAEIVAKYEPSVALIKGKKGSGTGFIARPGIVATNAHVLSTERINDIEVRFPSAEERQQGPYPARLLFQDRERDLALLAVKTELPAVQVADHYKFRKGEDVTVIGNPGVGRQMILENAISRGVVSSMTKINEHVFLQLGISINPGNSGGPVFDPTGRVIGVVTLKTTKQEGLAFAVPAEDLLSALETAQTMLESTPAAETPIASTPAEADPTEAAPAAPTAPKETYTFRGTGPAPSLAYAWKLGETYVYSFNLTLDAGVNVVSLQGSSIYRVKAVDGDGITLGHRGWYVTTRRNKDGKLVRGGNGVTKTIDEVELKIEPNGEVVTASGSSQLPLVGDFAMLLIEPLPDEARRTWDESKTITLNEVEQVPGGGAGVPKLGRPGVNNMPGGGARSRIAQRRQQAGRPPAPVPPPSQPSVKVTAHEATEESNYTVGDLKGDAAPIRKNYELTTREMVGDDPRLKMTGEGILAFDIKAGIPVSLEYELNVAETAGNATFRLPIKVTCKLLEGRDRENGLRAPVNTPTAMNKITGADLNKFLTALNLSDVSTRREACRNLYDSAPIENRRDEVSRALEKLVSIEDMGVRSDVIKAIGIWGDTKLVDVLFNNLEDESYGVRDELFEALSRLSPTEKLAEILIPTLKNERDRARQALQAIGTPAEGPLLKAVEESDIFEVRYESCRLLKEVGTPRSIPVLKKLIEVKQDGAVAGAAYEAIRKITPRWPEDDDWGIIVKQALSLDDDYRRRTVERLNLIDPVEAHRDEVAKALEVLVNDPDGQIQLMAIRALKSWGNAGSRAVLIEKLNDPNLGPLGEVIQTLAALGPEERSAEAIARFVEKDQGAVFEAIAKMGPVAEKATISALKAVSKDPVRRSAVCGLLARIGTEASLPAIREACEGPFSGGCKAALQELEAKLRGEGEVGLVAGLKSTDLMKRSDCLKKIATLPRSRKGLNQAELARVLDGLWKDDDGFIKRALRDAILIWGDEKSADVLTEYLSDPEAKYWEEAVIALARLRPDARSAELAAARFGKNPGWFIEIGKTFPAQAEVPMLALAKGQGDLRLRLEACRALGIMGTPAVIPDLRVLARRHRADLVASAAEEALNAINAR